MQFPRLCCQLLESTKTRGHQVSSSARSTGRKRTPIIRTVSSSLWLTGNEDEMSKTPQLESNVMVRMRKASWLLRAVWGESGVLQVEKTLTWKLRALVSVCAPLRSRGHKTGRSLPGNRGSGAAQTCRIDLEPVLWLLVKPLTTRWADLFPLAPGRAWLFIYAQRRTAALLIPREQSHDRNVFVSLFQLSHCLQLSPFELLGFPDKQVAQIKTNSWHLSSWDEKSSALLVGFRF